MGRTSGANRMAPSRGGFDSYAFRRTPIISDSDISISLEDEVAIGGHTRLEDGVLAVLLRPGSIPTSSAPDSHVPGASPHNRGVSVNRVDDQRRAKRLDRNAPPAIATRITHVPSASRRGIVIRRSRWETR